MLKIAVCDDQPECLATIANSLQAYLQPRPSLFGRVSLFDNGQALLDAAAADDGFDIYLLDILMPEHDGIQVGQRLRELGEDGEIIFLTCSNDYAADSYNVGAFFYLLKPIDEQKLFQVLDAAAAKLNRRRRAVLVATKHGPRRISLEHILYAERVGRIMRYYCSDGTVDSQTLRVAFHEAAAPLLSDSRFFLCGASLVLNFDHVTGVDGQIALMDDGREVPLPRTSAVPFKNAWGRYWLEEDAACHLS